jgi:prepilin-type processing-associated H-X9-DG protein
MWYYCPARREPPQFSLSGDEPSDGFPQKVMFAGALGDYAAAAGDGSPLHPWDGPDSGAALVEADAKMAADHRMLSWRGRTAVRLIQGGNEPVLQVGKAEGAPPPLQELKRGTSSTVLLGEKHVPWGKFGQAEQGDGSLYNGDYPGSFSRVGGVGFGLAQSVGDPYNRNFGSAHTGVCQFLMADGSVRPLANAVSPEILGKLLLRDPGE